MPSHLTDPEQLKTLLGIPFTPEQMACVTAPLEPGVIVAGAGSGKTTVMAARVVWLVGTGQVAADRVLGLTFTNKAAGELAERVRAALVRAGVTDPDAPAPEAGEPRVSTYHAFAGQLLKDHGLRIGLEPTARLLADATRFQLAARVLAAAPGPYPGLTKGLPTLAADLLALDGELSEHLVTPADARTADAALAARLDPLDPAKRGYAWVRDVTAAVHARRELTGLVAAYRDEKNRRDLLDFGDQIALSARLAGTRPEVGVLLREEFGVVLLDEYQDTSVAQRLLLAALFGDGTGHPVTAVGDPCQAIYGWRGASVANLDDFPRHFPRADGTPAARHSLSENRRSGGRLLRLANTLAAPLRALHEGVEALRPAPGAEHDGLVRCALLPTHADETAWLADSVRHLTDTGTPPGEIAVLCRTGGQFADLHAALVAREVPVEVVGLSGLLHLPEVADTVATCEVLFDPTANAALVRLLTGPRWRVGPRDLALLGRRARLLVGHGPGGPDDAREALARAVEGTDPAEVVSLADALETFTEPSRPDDGLAFSAEARARFAALATEIRDLRRALADPLMDVLHRVLAVTGLEVELAASPQALAARRRETLRAFLDIAAGFASLDGEATLPAFLAFLRTAARHDKGLDSSLPGGENTVKMLTAHKSKGLEWDVVVVPGLVRDAFPSAKVRELWPWHAQVLPHALRGDAATLPDVAEWTKKGVDGFRAAMREHNATEELRLGYVTFTRPRSLLLASGHWWGPTQKTPRGPSEFLWRLREHCESGAGFGEVEHWADEPAEDDTNPALDTAGDHAWPLPLDPVARDRRRAAAEAVLRRLDGGIPAGEGRRPGERLQPGEGRQPGEGLQSGEGRQSGEGEEAWRSSDERDGGDAALTPEEARLAASWDRDLDALAGELRLARRTVRHVPLPAALTATQLMRLAEDPDGFARELARPVPRPPQPAARRGTRFHAWVQSRFEEIPLIGLDDLPGIEPDPGAAIDDEADLEGLKEAFLRTPYAHLTPYRVEVPVQLPLAGRVVRGRIDAVYRTGGGDPGGADGGGVGTGGADGADPGGDAGPGGRSASGAGADSDSVGEPVRYEVVDWKTHRDPVADPLQLAVYRLAWAERAGVPLDRVTAAFVYIRTGRVVRPAALPGRRELERLLSRRGEDG